MNNVARFFRPRGLAKAALAAEIEALVGARLRALDGFMAEELRSDVAAIDAVGHYLTGAGGKRIRPTALLLGLSLCEYRGEADLPLAAAVEFIHTATLIHDDVIDGAATRRGRETVNRRWGNTATVLIGDHIYAKAMALALRAGSLPVLAVIADMTVKMVEGELLQAERAFDAGATLADYYDVIRRKTAHLFACSLKIAGLASGASAPQIAALEDYGTRLGLAFQITDDLLDLTGDPAQTGKPTLSDLAEGKITLPLLLAREEAPGAVAPLIARICEARAVSDDDRARLLAAVRRTGALAAARQTAAQEAAQAEAALRVFAPSRAREVLAALPALVLERDA